MQPTQIQRRAVVRLSVAATATAGLLGALLWSGTLSNSETLLMRSYQTALAEANTAPTVAAHLNATPAALQDDSTLRPVEALWPGKPGDKSLALRRPLVVGDRITITARDGAPQRLAVIELKDLDGAAIGVTGVRFQLVTSRVEGAQESEHVRLLIAVEPDGVLPAPSGNKTL